MWRYLYYKIIEISSISNHDFICLVAHYNDLLNGNKNKVDKDINVRGYSKEAIALTKEKVKAKFNAFESCGLRFTKSTEDLIFPNMYYLLTLFENYEKGLLPFPGPISDQPSQVIDMFLVITTIKNERNLIEMNKARI